VDLAVVGAHLTGQPLNSQLTKRGARLKRTCRTAPGYRLYALAGTKPPKPGLVRDDRFQGPGIEVEVGRYGGPIRQFRGGGPRASRHRQRHARFRRNGQCFICEPYALAAATEITRFGGWRNYLSSLNS